ncbi:MAG: pitrilysin family protein [Acidimicrobiales bacterium]|jgi:predicted Zn-dependent peptidase
MITTTTLDSGITVVTESMPEVASLCVGVWVGTGSRDETPEQSGISHFLEHLLFKGTPERTAREIAEEVDAVGGDMNAYTTKEYTTFYVRALAEHLELGLDILCDILCRPALRPEEVDAERQVILEEVLMHRDEPADVVQELFAGAMFPLHPLGREVLGEPEVITKVTVAEIRSFFEAHYLPANMVIAAAGELDHDRLAAGIEERFAGRFGGHSPERKAPAAQSIPLVVESRETEQAQLVLGVRAPDRHSPQRFALAVLNHVLGGGLSSRLFQEIREARGLAYSIGSDRSAYDDAGTLAVSVGTAPEHAHEVLGLLHGELDRLGAEGITQRELEVAKGHLRADMLLSLEDSGSRMSRIGSAKLLFGTVLTTEELLEAVAAVTLEHVAEIAGELLGERRTLAVVGPFSDSDFA